MPFYFYLGIVVGIVIGMGVAAILQMNSDHRNTKPPPAGTLTDRRRSRGRHG